jgi:hypothetical protein
MANLTMNLLDEGKMYRSCVDYCRVNQWKLLKRYEVPETIVSVIQSFHEGTLARVRLQVNYSESFALETGPKLGSVPGIQ